MPPTSPAIESPSKEATEVTVKGIFLEPRVPDDISVEDLAGLLEVSTTRLLDDINCGKIAGLEPRTISFTPEQATLTAQFYVSLVTAEMGGFWPVDDTTAYVGLDEPEGQGDQSDAYSSLPDLDFE